MPFERGTQRPQVQVAGDPGELLPRPPHPGRAPAQRHLPIAPAFDVRAAITTDTDHRLDGIGRAQRASQRGWYAQTQHHEGLVQALRRLAAAPGWVRSNSAAREGLLALAVGTGLQVMAAIMEADVAAACGPKGRHDPERTATRHGRGAGSVSLGGGRIPVERPRMRAIDGSGELPVPAYELFSDTEVLGRIALERMLAGLSTRRYEGGLDPVEPRTAEAETAPSKSAVSRRFVAQTQTALAELLAADLTSPDLVVFIV